MTVKQKLTFSSLGSYQCTIDIEYTYTTCNIDVTMFRYML